MTSATARPPAAHRLSGGSGSTWAPQATVGEGAAVLAKIAAGDSATLAQLYLPHEERLRDFIGRGLSRYLSSGADEDLVDEVLSRTLIAYWRKADQFARASAGAGECDPVGLLFGFARTGVRALVGSLRQRSAREVRFDVAIPFPESDRRCASPEKDAPTDFVTAVHVALQQMPTDLRTAVAAIHIHGMTVQQASRRWGITERAVSARLTAGRNALAERLAGFRHAWIGFDAPDADTPLQDRADELLAVVMLYLGQHPDATGEEVRDHIAAHVGLRLNVAHVRNVYVRRARALLSLRNAKVAA